MLATIFVSLPFVAREVIPTLREIGDEQEQAAHDARRVRLADVLADHAAVDQVGRHLRRRAHDRALLRRVRRRRWSSRGTSRARPQTATLRVDEAAQFAYGNYAAAYGISLVLAVMAILVLLSMLLIQRKGSRA